MGISKCICAHLFGLECHLVSIEVDITNGLHTFSIVGLGDRAVEEAKDRISAAIKNSGFQSPKQRNQKVIISLAPAFVRKEGSSFDLAMSIAYLSATKDILCDISNIIFLGELSLDGSIQKISGIVPILRGMKDKGFRQFIIPSDNSFEASFVSDIDAYPARSLKDVILHISGQKSLDKIPSQKIVSQTVDSNYDFKYVRGNQFAKRGLEIASAGGHNVLLHGPPGTGKTLLAKSFTSILPDLSDEQAMEVMSIYSAAKINIKTFDTRPPFRSPHHTASYASVVGGGSFPRPGEITLAHRGVLFLDELPEFGRDVIEALRQPLEDSVITIARAQGTVTFPARCILIASMNPCPCGMGSKGCTCPPRLVEAYKRRVSGPILDRIDLSISVEKVDYKRLSQSNQIYHEESSQDVLNRVRKARQIQYNRYDGKSLLNSELGPKDIEKYANLNSESREHIEKVSEKMNISARAFHRIIKVSRTIADLEESSEIKPNHIFEALQYRQSI
jgi:magnesium chelatase family protein